jgi:hypothetical protein
MLDTTTVAVIASLPSVISGAGLYLCWRASNRSADAVESLHKLINLRMDDWVAAEKVTSRAQGHEEGMTQERVDERARRQQVISDADDQSEL